MNWWAWAIAGAILLGAELGFIDAQFYLVFVGVSALIVGAVTLLVPTTPTWVEWALFAVLAILTVSTFRRIIYARLRRDAPSPVRHGPAGDVLTLPSRLAPGESCQVEYRGSHWTATNGSSEAVEAGSRVRITHVQGLALIVHADA
jgi:membrane protein implicated in regulation of membrane protease activity